MEPDGGPIPDHLLPAPILLHHSRVLTMMLQARTEEEFERAASPRTTSTGLKVTKTFTITEAEVGEGLIQYELLVDGESIWVGMGDDRVDGLLKIIIRITDQEPEIPNN